MHVTAAEKPLGQGGKFFQHEETFQVAYCALPHPTYTSTVL